MSYLSSGRCLLPLLQSSPWQGRTCPSVQKPECTSAAGLKCFHPRRPSAPSLALLGSGPFTIQRPTLPLRSPVLRPGKGLGRGQGPGAVCSPTSLSPPDSGGFPALLSASLESLWRLFSCLLQSVSLLTSDYSLERMRLSEEKGGIKKAGLTMNVGPLR